MIPLKELTPPLPPALRAPSSDGVSKSASAETAPETARMPGGLTPRHLEALWERMVRIYGKKWIDNFGEADDGTWLTGLYDVTPHEIARGLDACRTSRSPWPPTLPQFRALCKPTIV